MSKITTVAQFKKALNLGVKQITQGKANVWLAACFAITHYDSCGDHGPLNDVMEALRGKAGVGANSYRNWVEKYTDQVWDQEAKKLVRDATQDVVANVEGAVKENFWDAVKVEQEVQDFTQESFYKEMLKLVKKYQNEDRYHASNDDAKSAVKSAMDHLKLKAPGVVLAA